jgi:uncharacterized protein (TIGR03435 family)
MMSILFRAVIFLLVASPAFTQSQSFTTITIKPAASADQQNARVQVLPNGDLIARSISVATLLSDAYDLPANGSPRLSTVLPEWTIFEKYDIEAKAPANAAALSSLPDSEVRSAIQQMIRGLLADRFELVMRVENKTMPVYALTILSGGPKLQKLAVSEKQCTFDTDGCHSFEGGLGHPLNAKAIDMDDVAHYIENWTDLPVVNRTALTGLFAVNSEGWLPMRLPPPPPGAASDVNHFAGLPTIFTVLGKLGLELKREEAIVPVYTLECIERPAVN